MKIKIISILCLLALSQSVKKKKQTSLNAPEDLVDISPYDYPTPSEDKDNYQIAIFGSSDFHGACLPVDQKNDVTGQDYTKGGVEYVGKYIDLMKKTWGDRFIYLDAGDFQQGAYESTVSNGKCMVDFFNWADLTAMTFGNHQLQDTEKVLDSRMDMADFPFVLTNGFDTDTLSNFLFDGQFPFMMKQVGEVTLGIVGYSTMESLDRSKKGFPDLNLTDDTTSLMGTAELLRKTGADAVILLAHEGYECKNSNIYEKITLDIRGPDSENLCKAKGPLADILNEMPKYTFDAVVAGHVHLPNSFFVNGVPAITPTKSMPDTNIIYLTFDKNKKVIHEKTLIEGPIPICDKVFPNSKKCQTNGVNLKAEGEMKPYKFHGVKIEKQPEVTEIEKPYIEMMQELKNDIVFETDSDIPLGEPYVNMFMADVYADTVKEFTGSDFAVVNLRGFRGEVPKGKVNKLQFQNMFPYGGEIVKAELKGKDVKRMVEIIEEGKKAYFALSGLKAKYNKHDNQILEVTLSDGSEIEENKKYTVSATAYFLVNGGDDFKYLFEKSKPKIVKRYGKDINELMYEKLKEKGTIKKDDYEAPDKVRITVV